MISENEIFVTIISRLGAIAESIIYFSVKSCPLLPFRFI